MLEGTFTNYLRNEIINKNLNCVIAVIGKPGKGKSYLSLKIGQKLDPNFGIEKVCFDVEEFVKLYLPDAKIKIDGGVCMLEEAGVSLHHHSWYENIQKNFNQMIQVFRNKRTITIFTLPHLRYLNSDTQRMINIIIEPVEIIRSRNLCKAKIHLLQVNPHSGYIYRKRLRTIVNGQVVRHTYHTFSLPSKDLLRAYEIKKNQFNDSLYSIIHNKIVSQRKEGEEKKELTGITEQDKNILALFVSGKHASAIGRELSLSPASVHYSKNKLINLGYLPRSSKKKIEGKIYKVEKSLEKNSADTNKVSEEKLKRAESLNNMFK